MVYINNNKGVKKMRITNNMIIDTHIRKSRIPYINEENNCMSKNFDNEYKARKWESKFKKTAHKLNKIGFSNIINNFKTIEYKIITIDMTKK